MLRLVVAMGIGRFAFTPQVPLMIRDRAAHADQRRAGGGDELSGLSGRRVGRDARHAPRRAAPVVGRMGRDGADVAVGAVSADAEWLHAVVRFVIGWASGWAMVLVAAWTNERLAHHGRPGLSAAVFAGPGAGIFLSGMLAVGTAARQRRERGVCLGGVRRAGAGADCRWWRATCRDPGSSIDPAPRRSRWC